MNPRSCLLLLSALMALPGAARAARTVIRVGYFPNVTHAQGVIGSHGTAGGHGWFEERLGPGVEIQWFAFNAGPSAMEAVFAGSIDLTYVGPNPSLNAYIRSGGDEVRVLAGAAEGGAALVVARDGRIKTAADFRGKKLATPQLGNTQDVAARAWLQKQGFRVTQTGGDVMVVPTANPDQLALLSQGEIDAVWTVEPWVTRLEQEAGARVFLEQPDAVITILVSSVRFLREHPDLAARFRAAHDELTAWINTHGPEAREQVRAGLSATVRREISVELVAGAWRRLRFTARLQPAQFSSLVADAQSAGFLRDAIPLDRLFSGKP
jgi:NitT/TauT family transport system substrate-binding protein